MQQTSQYQLNLIEGSDDFLPDPINENMEKLEEVVAGQAQSLTQGLAQMTSGVAQMLAMVGSGGQNARIAWGSYTGTGTYGQNRPNSLSFDFYPLVVICGSNMNTTTEFWPTVMIRGCGKSHGDYGYEEMVVTWSDRGVSWYSTGHQLNQNNGSGYTYYYVVIGYDDGQD